jgi:hypothetical protein
VVALVVLWGLKPWEDDSSDPQVIPLGIEMAVGDGKALSSEQRASVAAGTIAPGGPKLVVGAGEPAGRDAGAGPVLAVAPGKAVVAPASVVTPAPSSPATPTPVSPEAQPVSAPAPEPAATPITAPVVTTPETARPGGPVSAGVGGFDEGCEGDEYLLTVTLLEEGLVSDESPVEIVVERINEDRSSDELQLEGDLSDARALVAALDSEGSCVKVEIVQFEGEDGKEEVPEASEEVAEPAEVPAPVSP